MSDYQVVNPATGEVEKEFETATDAEVQDVLARSHAAYAEWRTTSKAERPQVLLRVADLYDERRDELAAIIAREMGKPMREAKGELKLVASIYRYYADQGPRLLADAPLDPAMGGSALVRKEPVGALLGIMPWNFPYYQVARFAAPNLMIGNTIILKHAPQCPESALAMEQIFPDAGLPADAYINVFATNDQSADIIADPRVVGVSVTGCERAGSAVAEVAGRNLKKVVLELGGSDPFIVLDADDLGAAVKAAVRGRMGNAGQACNAAKRMIVVDELYDDFVEHFTAAMGGLTPGDPPTTRTGLRAAVLRGRRAEPARADRRRRREGRHRAHRRQARRPSRRLHGGDRADRRHARHARLQRGALRPGRGRLPGRRRRRGGRAGQQLGVRPRRRGLERRHRARPSRSPTGSTPAWSGSTAPRARPPTCPSAARSAPGVGRELGPYGIDEFVNKKLIYTPASR